METNHMEEDSLDINQIISSSSNGAAIDYAKYVSLAKPNFWKKWIGSDKKAEGIIIGCQIDKYKIWSAFYLKSYDKKDNIIWLPGKNDKSYCNPITGIDAKNLLIKYNSLC